MSSDDWYPARRLGAQLCPITIANFAFIQRGRPLHNGEKSPTASGGNRSAPESHGYAVTGHLALLLLLVTATLAAGWPKKSRFGNR